MKWPSEWKSKHEPDFPVKTETCRDAESVTYEVVVYEKDVPVYDNEGGRIVWSKEVAFGKTDATKAGGYCFQEAAQEQELMADAWAKAIAEAQGL
jgi:hypothetical protein